jgi:predicted amidophosphoribosyltransferase
VTIPDAGQECPHCKGALPAGRAITYCPHCGQDLTVQHCPACGSELEQGWKFCVTCGRAVSPP